MAKIAFNPLTGQFDMVGTSGGSSGASFTTFQTPSGTSPVAVGATDTMTFSVDGNLSITGNSSTDTIKFGLNTTIGPAAASGTNIAGTAFNVAGGQGTGTAVGGQINFQTSKAGTTGTTVNALSTIMSVGAAGVSIGSSTVSNLLTIVNASNLDSCLVIQDGSNHNWSITAEVGSGTNQRWFGFLVPGSNPFWFYSANSGFMGISPVNASAPHWPWHFTTTNTSTTPTGLAKDTTLSSLPVLALGNTSATVNNFSAYGFTTANNELAAHIAGIFEVHTAGSATGHLGFYTSNAGTQILAATITSKQSMVIGGTALGTTATDGFLYIPTCAGAPTGTPTAQSSTVPLVYDTTDNRLYAYNGAWLNQGAGNGVLPGTAKTANYSIVASDYAIKVDNTSGAFTVTMPSPSTSAGKIFVITNIGTGTNLITLAPNGAETFGAGALANLHLSTKGESWTLISDGTNWQIIAHYCNTPWTSYSATVGATTTAPTPGTGATLNAWWARRGDEMVVRWEYSQSAAGSSGSGSYTFPIVAGYAINSSTCTISPTGDSQDLGSASFLSSNAGTTAIAGWVQAASTTALQLWFTSSGVIGSGAGVFFNATTLRFGFEARIPIANWEP